MSKYMTIEVIRAEVIETAKAYGVKYDRDDCWKQDDNILWLPKSQCDIEDVTYEMYKAENGEHHAKWYFSEGFAWITVPMWLARKNNYFKHMVFHM